MWLIHSVNRLRMPFSNDADVAQNDRLRIPQREGWNAIRQHHQSDAAGENISIVLPVGCGKSGLIAITPYAVDARRVLVIAPGTRIRDQLGNDMKSSSEANFYERCAILPDNSIYPETVVIESGAVNHDDINHADIVVANIQQIAGEDNRWLDACSEDFFDAILVDEGHHNTAVSWQQVFARFPNASVINYSATPVRSDGQTMDGRVVYSFPVVQAISAGYVKRLAAKMLRPSELTYVDRSSGSERTIQLEEVISLGEENAEFRRGIVMSDNTLASIVDCSISELRRLREESSDQRLKIIASALNINHCIQIVEAFRARGLRADYVHSRETQVRNKQILSNLESHELDVIVQARMLGEGFDHPHLAVAMVGSIFSNLSPFVQFVGRVMRAIDQNDPNSVKNRGVVVFHAGANVAGRWSDFRQFSEADQEYFADLLPEPDDVDFGPSGLGERESGGGFGGIVPVDIVEERGVRAANLDPIGDPEAAELLRQLAERGITPEQAAEGIRRIRPTRQDQRAARRTALNDRIKNATGTCLHRLEISPGGRTLDPRRARRNFEWLLGEINRRINRHVDQSGRNRDNFTLDELNEAHGAMEDIISEIESEIGDA